MNLSLLRMSCINVVQYTLNNSDQCGSILFEPFSIILQKTVNCLPYRGLQKYVQGSKIVYKYNNK